MLVCLEMASLPSSMSTVPQLGVVSRVAEGVLDPAVHVINEDIKQYY